MNKLFELLFLESCKFALFFPLVLIITYFLIGNLSEFLFYSLLLIYVFVRIFVNRKRILK